MYKKLDFAQFSAAFSDMGKQNTFTYGGLKALYSHLLLMESLDGEKELDVKSICSDYTEYSSLKDLQKLYPDIKSNLELCEATHVIAVAHGTFIIENF